MKNPFTPTVRRYLYGIAIAFVPLAAYFGWIELEAVPLVLPLILAVLNVQSDPAVEEEVQG